MSTDEPNNPSWALAFSEGSDRRARRTKKALMDALLELLREKPLTAITVTELAKRADVNRATFYTHYQDVYDMYDHLIEALCSICRSIVDAHGSELAAGSYLGLIEDIYQFVDDNELVFNMALSPIRLHCRRRGEHPAQLAGPRPQGKRASHCADHGLVHSQLEPRWTLPYHGKHRPLPGRIGARQEALGKAAPPMPSAWGRHDRCPTARGFASPPARTRGSLAARPQPGKPTTLPVVSRHPSPSSRIPTPQPFRQENSHNALPPRPCGAFPLLRYT